MGENLSEGRSHAGDREHSRERKKHEQRREGKEPHKLAQDVRQLTAGNKAEELGRGQILGDFI